MVSSYLIYSSEDEALQKRGGDPLPFRLNDLLLEKTGFDHCIFGILVDP